ncbi:MFS transporter [Natronobeatus ordinarius]|uniref:MFS transporter n=1 Tax=Natronobeatus ordinarius TaxID=2963433 RepID=UPI0020CFB8E4|nr:MFS transporter [Natronobeatus ordinarius]
MAVDTVGCQNVFYAQYVTSAVESTRDVPDGRRSWAVAIVGALGMVFTFGTVFSYGVFLDPFTETFGIKPVALSTIFSAMLFMFFVGAGVMTIFAARVSARMVLLACAIATAAIAPALYVVEGYLGLFVVFVILGLALGTAFILMAAVIPQWFEERRGTATGLIFAGNGLGMFILPPTWQFAFERIGVREGFLLIMAATAVGFVFTGAACRRPRWVEPSTMATDEVVRWLGQMSRTRTFRLVFTGVALSFAWLHMVTAYAIELFTYRGMAGAAAATAFGAIGGVSIVSRLGSGYVADMVGFRRAFLASLSCSAAGIALLAAPQLVMLMVAIFLIGMGLGGMATLYVPLLMQIYEDESDTIIVGLSNVAIGFVAVAGPPLVVGILVHTGSFPAVIAITFLVAVGGIWTVAAGTKGD